MHNGLHNSSRFAICFGTILYKKAAAVVETIYYIYLYISVNFILLVSMASTGLPPLPGSGKLKTTLIDADNPFRLPGDDHVFRMREEEVHIRNI